jgi:hypothetical protein
MFQTSLYPYTWGGLPSLMAMWLGMAALYCVVYLPGWSGFLTSASLFAGTAMVHHHTMVALLGGAGAVALIGYAVSRRQRQFCNRLLSSLAAAAVVAGIYILPLLTRITEIGKTSILGYTEPFGWPWNQFWSWPADLISQVFTIVNAAVTVLAVILGFRMRARAATGVSCGLLFGVAAIWIGSFCVLDYGGRIVAHWLNRASKQPFTPSRFLFDAQFVFAIVASGGLVQIWQWLRRPAFRYAMLSMTACGAVAQTESRWEPMLDDSLVALGRWADQNLPSDALVTGTRGVWMTYIFHRESTSLFIPISEPVDPQRQLVKGKLRDRSSSLPWSHWSARLGKPIYVVRPIDPDPTKIRPLHQDGSIAIYDVNKR